MEGDNYLQGYRNNVMCIEIVYKVIKLMLTINR